MDYIHSLNEGTMLLNQAVRVLQGTGWEGNPEQARQYLISMDMDLAFASGLVADMEADNFAQTIQNLINGQAAATGYKSIAIWVRKFGFDANLAPSGEKWEICLHETGHGTAVCGTCKFWDDTICNCQDSEAFSTIRNENDWACANYTQRHMNRWGCAGIIALIVAVVAFLGIWIFSGDIWAAIILFEVIFEIILELIEAFS